MTEALPNLFDPIKIADCMLKNRITNTGHAPHFQAGDGTPTERYIVYIGERAKGGAGIVVTGHAVPVYDGKTSLSLTNYHDGNIPTRRTEPRGEH